MSWIDRIPLMLLLVITFVLGTAPITAEPHLLEKSRMLLEGTLVKPIDIFDLFMHATPLVLLIVRLTRMVFKVVDTDNPTNND